MMEDLFRIVTIVPYMFIAVFVMVTMAIFLTQSNIWTNYEVGVSS